MTQRRPKLNLGPGGQQKPPPKHAFTDGVAAEAPPAAGSQDDSGTSHREPSRSQPGAADSSRQAAPEGTAEDSRPVGSESGLSAALPPAAGRLLRHPAVRVGLVSAAAALSIWLLRRRLF